MAAPSKNKAEAAPGILRLLESNDDVSVEEGDVSNTESSIKYCDYENEGKNDGENELED